MPPNDREFNLLSNRAIESFWDALWLELWPFLCSIVEPRRIRAPMPSNEVRCNFLVCGVSAGGWQFPRICACVGMCDMWGRAALSSGRATCDTFAPDSSSSSPACGCESCNKCTTILVKTPHHRACVGIMCYTFSKNPSSSSELISLRDSRRGHSRHRGLETL